jgi:chromosome segregation ATPase
MLQAVDKAKQLRAQCQALEAQVADAGTVREELSRVQSQLGSLHGINSALKSQLKAARERQEEAASVREGMLRAQLAELERTVGERNAQMEALAASTAQVIPAAATIALHELCCIPRPAVPCVYASAHYICCGMCRLERRCRCW